MSDEKGVATCRSAGVAKQLKFMCVNVVVVIVSLVVSLHHEPNYGG